MALAALLVVGVTTPAQAISYNYMAGHTMRIAHKTCTGGWTVQGSSGTFALTAAHCSEGVVGRTVFGTQSDFGTVAHVKYEGSQGDSALVRMYAGVTPYQIVVDPTTGRSPGDGRVTGIMRNSEQAIGTRVGKMGVSTGWTEGTIEFRYNWYGQMTNCASYARADGDSGGPVWRMDGSGLRAVGMHVSWATLTNGQVYGCYIPIETLLNQWGATLPVFPSPYSSYSTKESVQSTAPAALPPVLTAADGVVMGSD